MIVVDTMLARSLRFVFNRIAEAVDANLDDEGRLKEELLAAQMKLEIGELTETEFAAVEKELLTALRQAREAREGGATGAVTGIESVELDQPLDLPAPKPRKRRRR